MKVYDFYDRIMNNDMLGGCGTQHAVREAFYVTILIAITS